jgi:hypothetical protein
MGDPKYVDPEDPFGDSFVPFRIYEWQKPRSDSEKKILSAVGRKIYTKKWERSEVVKITKAMMPLDSGVVSVYPVEWVVHCCEWAAKKRNKSKPELVGLKGLLTYICNTEAKKEFLARLSTQESKDF